jgi:hypothetical protein
MCKKKIWVQHENLQKNTYDTVTCITNQILALHPWSLGWRSLSKTEKRVPQAHTQQVFIGWPSGMYHKACTTMQTQGGGNKHKKHG